jgi:DNA-binding response OmpR family regulator
MAKVLVVDDEKDVVELIEYALGKEGYSVSGAYNGKEGLEAAKADPPDLIILDVMMPEMDGFTMNNRLMDDPQLRAVPVIILTAKGQMRDMFETLPNVRRYVEKPFDPSELRRHVADILKK